MTSKHLWLMSIGLCTWASIAHAHISITDGGTHVGRSEEMKDVPCGGPEARGSGMVYTYKPGETINITIKETVSHPSYFRIAFDDDGDDGFVTPSGSIGEMGDCGTDPACGPGKEDYCNNDTVLLDHLNLHASSFGTTPDWTFSVTLPNVECANCTLQIIQVMNDMGIHFQPYPADDIYYQCIDLVLSPSAPDVNDTPVANDGMVCAGGGMAGAGGMGGMAGGAAGMGGMAGGAAGMGGMGGMSGAAGGAATSGGGAGMPGMAGMTGTAGMLAAAGAGGAGGGAAGAPVAGTTAVPPTTGQPSSSNGGGGGGGGCNAAGNAGFGGVGALGLSLLALAARRRRAHG